MNPQVNSENMAIGYCDKCYTTGIVCTGDRCKCLFGQQKNPQVNSENMAIKCKVCKDTGFVPFKYYEHSRYFNKQYMSCSCSPITKNEPFFNLDENFLYDITRFSNLHSWYKHFRVAKIYYLVPSDKIQEPWKLSIRDTEESKKPRVFWHFVIKDDLNGLKLPEALENLVRKFPLSFNKDVNNGWKLDTQKDKHHLESHVVEIMRVRQDMENLREEIYEAFMGISNKAGSLLNTSSNSGDIVLTDGSILKRIN
jgi:hypothetical protein